MKAKILVVEDEEALRSLLLEVMSLEGHVCEGVASVAAAVKRLSETKFDILLTDVNLPDESGLSILPICARLNPATYMLVMTGFASIDVAVTAMKNGATDFLTKPISLNNLLAVIRVAISRIAAASPIETAAAASATIVAKSPIMLDLLAQIELVAPFKASVLITGETGTGKELVARALHAGSPRRDKNLIALNCAAIPEQLLEDELFGHVKGAFTGAQTARAGRLEQADGGTLFLDEIGDMNLSLQAKLLRVLQECEFERLGSSQTIKSDVRVVAATSANIEQKIADNSFRADLYHRLNVVQLNVPPLRARRSDVLPIAAVLLERFCASAGLPPKTLSSEAAGALNDYDFPGNVRQLQNAVERAAIYSGLAATIEIEHLPEEIKLSKTHGNHANGFHVPTAIPDEGLDFTNIVSGIERELLQQTLHKTGGNKMQAAKLLNMKRTTLIEKLKRLHIESEETVE